MWSLDAAAVLDCWSLEAKIRRGEDSPTMGKWRESMRGLSGNDLMREFEPGMVGKALVAEQ